MILWENRANNTIHLWNSFLLFGVDDELVFVQSCSSCCSHSGCRCCSLDSLGSFLDIGGDFDNDLGIAVCVSVLVPPRIPQRWLPFLQSLGPVFV